MKRLLLLPLLLVAIACASTQPSGNVLVLTGATVYASPDAVAMRDGVIVIRDGVIDAVGPRSSTAIPQNATVIDCAGTSITAGFWNSHVHLYGDEWDTAVAKHDHATMTALLRERMTRYGFTHIVDTGSIAGKAATVRRAIESGEAVGPAILSVGPIVFPKNGTPQFVVDKHGRFPEAGTSAEARAIVDKLVADGVDAIKIYVVAWMGGPRIVMPADIVAALADQAHKRGKLAFAHPGTPTGWQQAIDANVDVIVHSNPNLGNYVDAQIARLVSQHTSVIPTLTLFRFDDMREGRSEADAKHTQAGATEWVRKFVAAGGDVLFGTDIGWITDYDTTEEVEQMGKAGMSFRQILASMTTAPAARFLRSADAATLKRGNAGDVVVLRGDPANDVKAFAQVLLTIRGGKIIYDGRATPSR